jgi:8-oxo-dGTP pyrophosphatase MutT (NUDIX family)
MAAVGAKLPLTTLASRVHFCRMINVQKACPIVIRATKHGLEVLAFRHPSAGNQFVKGTIQQGEHPRDAAKRELLEESGLDCPIEMSFLGALHVGPEQILWHFFTWGSTGLPDQWKHAAEDDGGHTFAFFWHPIRVPLDEEWHPVFHEAFQFFASRLAAL